MSSTTFSPMPVCRSLSRRTRSALSRMSISRPLLRVASHSLREEGFDIFFTMARAISLSFLSTCSGPRVKRLSSVCSASFSASVQVARSTGVVAREYVDRVPLHDERCVHGAGGKQVLPVSMYVVN